MFLSLNSAVFVEQLSCKIMLICLYDLFFSDWFERQNLGRHTRNRLSPSDVSFSRFQDGRVYHKV